MGLHRFIVIGLSFTIILATACSSESSGPCAQRKGTYLSRYTVRSGDCGEVSEQLSTVDKQPTEVTAPCMGSITYSADNCEVTVDVTCPGRTPGVTVRNEAKARWSQDGSQGTAIEQTTITDVQRIHECHGSYDVLMTRQ